MAKTAANHQPSPTPSLAPSLTPTLGRFWFIVETPGNMERVAKRHLDFLGFETYLPMRQVEKTVVGRLMPLFPHYLFVLVDMDAPRWSHIRSSVGVRCILSAGDKPAAAPHDLVPAIRAREVMGIVQMPKTAAAKAAAFEHGDVVRILDGRFCGYDALFDARMGKERIMVLLSFLGRSSRVSLAIKDVRNTVDRTVSVADA